MKNGDLIAFPHPVAYGRGQGLSAEEVAVSPESLLPFNWVFTLSYY